MKACRTCKDTKPENAFYKLKGRLMNNCMECHRKEVQIHYEKTRPADRPRLKKFNPTLPKPCFTCKKVLAPEKFYQSRGKLSAYCKICASNRARTIYRQKTLFAVAS
jgi:hypothetical protein